MFILTSNCSKLNFFGFGEEKNEFDKLKINEYLWIASNELLKNYTNTQSNLKEGNIVEILEYTPRGGGAPFEKLELAFRNQLAQTNGVLFRRPRGTSENRIALANRTIDCDLLMVRWHYSRGSGK